MKKSKTISDTTHITLREISTSMKDYFFMADMVYEAAFVPEGISPYPPSLILQPELKKYYENWGQPTDFGCFAQLGLSGVKLGGAWCRLFSAENKGYGFVSESIPELTIALQPQHRNKKIGSILLEKIIAEAKERNFEAISLSVDDRNVAAWKLYKKFGFEIYFEGFHHWIMILKF